MTLTKGDFEEFIDFQRVPLQGLGVKKLKINELRLFGADSTFKYKAMTLKINFISIILTGCLSVMIITSCGSHKQKPADAFDLVKKERMMSTDSSFVSKEIIQESMKTELPVKKIETPDEWTKFKIETERKIRQNENKIKEIRGLPDINASLRRKVTKLEKDNNDLRIRMDEYKEEVKVKWEMFQASMNHNVNEINIELKAIKGDSKK